VILDKWFVRAIQICFECFALVYLHLQSCVLFLSLVNALKKKKQSLSHQSFQLIRDRSTITHRFLNYAKFRICNSSFDRGSYLCRDVKSCKLMSDHYRLTTSISLNLEMTMTFNSNIIFYIS